MKRTKARGPSETREAARDVIGISKLATTVTRKKHGNGHEEIVEQRERGTQIVLGAGFVQVRDGCCYVRAYEAMRDHDEKCEFAVSMENEWVSVEYGSLLL